jgi:hypothetical protein
MASELVVRFVVEALDRGLLDRAVHALDLAVGPRMLGFGQAMIDVGAGAGVFEGMGPEQLLALDLPDLGRVSAYPVIMRTLISGRFARTRRATSTPFTSDIA